MDLSVNNRTGTVVGAGATWVAATNGLGDIYSLDGTASTGIRVDGTDAQTFTDGATNLTMSLWVKVNTFVRYDGILCSRGSKYNLLYMDNTVRYRWLTSGAGALESANNSISVGEWQHVVVTSDQNPVGSTGTNKMFIGGELKVVAYAAGGASFGQDDYWYVGWDDCATARSSDADFAFVTIDSGRGEASTWTPANITETNIVQAAALGVLSGAAENDRTLLAACSSVVTCNQGFQDWKIKGVVDSADLPALAGTPDIGWGAGNGVAEHLNITVANASNIMFSAGTTAATMTNYAIIDGVQYTDGAPQAFSNVYYEHYAASNVFWRVGGSTYYAGNIAQIHQGGADLTPTMYTNFDTYVKANIKWNP